jgi:hypothetical protein
MRKVLVAVILLLAASEALAVDPPDMALVAVNNPGPETAAQLLAQDVMVVRDMERYLLAVAGPDDLRLMKDLGLDLTVLDSPISGKSYYTVGVGKRATSGQVAAHGRLLRFDGLEAVVEASQEGAMDLAGLGLHPSDQRRSRGEVHSAQDGGGV